jgi:hypothetical protein
VFKVSLKVYFWTSLIFLETLGFLSYADGSFMYWGTFTIYFLVLVANHLHGNLVARDVENKKRHYLFIAVLFGLQIAQTYVYIALWSSRLLDWTKISELTYLLIRLRYYSMIAFPFSIGAFVWVLLTERKLMSFEAEEDSSLEIDSDQMLEDADEAMIAQDA